MRRLSLVMGALLLTAAPAAWGATSSFNIGATCTANCAAAGLDAGDLITGAITLSTDGFAPGGSVARAAVQNFAVLFGTTETSILEAESQAWNFSAIWGIDRNAIAGVSFTASGPTGIGAAGPLFTTGVGGNLVSLTGTCGDALCTPPGFDGTAATLSPVRFTPRDVAPVPLPPTGLLAAAAALALAAVAWLRRDRRLAAA
jgi:hypothetical protein